jgi:hypothetical protein
VTNRQRADERGSPALVTGDKRTMRISPRSGSRQKFVVSTHGLKGAGRKKKRFRGESLRFLQKYFQYWLDKPKKVK